MAINAGNSFRSRDKLNVGAQTFEVHRLELLEDQGVTELAKLPFSLRILLENLLRFEDGRFVHAEDIQALARLRKRLLSCRRACCSKTSPAYPRSWILPPCAKPL